MRKLSHMLIGAAAFVLANAMAVAQESVLEHYVLGAGGTIAPDPGNFNAFIQDARFGGGDAIGSLFLDRAGGATLLHVRVWRNVPAGNISFALLVFGVEVRGYAADGSEVFTRNLADFSFGDSQSGNWARRITLPRTVNRVEVRFLGNYE